MIKQGNLLAYDLGSLKLYSNTLQAIAAGYLITAIIILHFKAGLQYLSFIGLLLGYWALLAWVQVPGGEAGRLTPDGNLAIYVDKLILGRFQDGTPYTWIVSSMAFAATVLMGVFSGRFLRKIFPVPTKRQDWSLRGWHVYSLVGCGMAGLRLSSICGRVRLFVFRRDVHGSAGGVLFSD